MRQSAGKGIETGEAAVRNPTNVCANGVVQCRWAGVCGKSNVCVTALRWDCWSRWGILNTMGHNEHTGVLGKARVA